VGLEQLSLTIKNIEFEKKILEIESKKQKGKSYSCEWTSCSLTLYSGCLSWMVSGSPTNLLSLRDIVEVEGKGNVLVLHTKREGEEAEEVRFRMGQEHNNWIDLLNWCQLCLRSDAMLLPLAEVTVRDVSSDAPVAVDCLQNINGHVWSVDRSLRVFLFFLHLFFFCFGPLLSSPLFLSPLLSSSLLSSPPLSSLSFPISLLIQPPPKQIMEWHIEEDYTGVKRKPFDIHPRRTLAMKNDDPVVVPPSFVHVGQEELWLMTKEKILLAKYSSFFEVEQGKGSDIEQFDSVIDLRGENDGDDGDDPEGGRGWGGEEEERGGGRQEEERREGERRRGGEERERENLHPDNSNTRG